MDLFLVLFFRHLAPAVQAVYFRGFTRTPRNPVEEKTSESSNKHVYGTRFPRCGPVLLTATFARLWKQCVCGYRGGLTVLVVRSFRERRTRSGNPDMGTNRADCDTWADLPLFQPQRLRLRNISLKKVRS